MGEEPDRREVVGLAAHGELFARHEGFVRVVLRIAEALADAYPTSPGIGLGRDSGYLEQAVQNQGENWFKQEAKGHTPAQCV